MPGTHCLGYRAIAHQYCVYGGSEESLDECSGVGVGADEVTERTENRAFTKYSALLEQTRSGRSETDALPFKPFQCIELGAQSGVQIFGWVSKHCPPGPR